MSHQQDFIDLKLKIECKCITLTQCKENPVIISGPGEIWQDAEGVLQFKFFVNDPAYSQLQKELSATWGEVGKLIPDTQYFSLQAQEFHGPIWTCVRILPEQRGSYGSGVVYGHIRELTRKETYNPRPLENDFIRMWIKGKHEFPCNQQTEIKTMVGKEDRAWSHSFNVALVDHGGFQFEFSPDGEHTKVSLRAPKGLHLRTLVMRTQEALQFVWGQDAPMMVVETKVDAGAEMQNEIWLRSAPPHQENKIYPPVTISRHEENGFWTMFHKYLEYVFLDKSPESHPLSWRVNSVIGARTASIETEVLVLTTAVEWLAGNFPIKSDADFQNDLETIQCLISSANITSKGKERIKGSLGAMKGIRNSDMLRAFIKNQGMSDGFFDAWKKLRNPAAHGDGCDDRDFEDTLRLKDQVMCLFYALIFSTIGYSGPRTDYSQPNWPLAHWPPVPSSTPPAR